MIKETSHVLARRRRRMKGILPKHAVLKRASFHARSARASSFRPLQLCEPAEESRLLPRYQFLMSDQLKHVTNSRSWSWTTYARPFHVVLRTVSDNLRPFPTSDTGGRSTWIQFDWWDSMMGSPSRSLFFDK